MNKNLTEIIFIIDESGSMYSLTDDTIGGFNGFVESQMTLPGEAYLTTVLFNVNHHTLHDGVDLREVRRMTREDYTPGGGTAGHSCTPSTPRNRTAAAPPPHSNPCRRRR